MIKHAGRPTRVDVAVRHQPGAVAVEVVDDGRGLAATAVEGPTGDGADGLRMPVMDGLEATRRITCDASLAATRVVILTTFDLDEYVHEALRAGASGFLLKDTMPVACCTQCAS